MLSKISKNNIYLGLIIFLVISNIFSIFWFIDAKNDLNINKYKYIDISRSFISQDDFIVNLESLRKNINQIAKEFGEDKVSVYIEFLNTGANISINKENYIWPASLTKLPVAMAVMKKIEQGDWQLSNELVLMPGDANQMSGDADNPLSEYPVGTRFTIEKLLEELLIKSDNTAYYILLRNIHQDELKAVILDVGIESLFSEDGQISSKEYSRIFRALYTSSFLKRENSQYLLELLNRSIFDEFLSHGVPDTIDFPHKYGQDDQNMAYSDSGIVYIPNRPYIITVMVEGEKGQPFEQEKAKAADFMRAISEMTYSYFVSQE